jgi:ABC-type transport system involved in Fe-S cluster assembly fused permease/ATPase subunit
MSDIQYKKVGELHIDVNAEIEIMDSNTKQKKSMEKSQTSMFDERECQDLAWSDMNFNVNGSKNILSNCWGSAKSGEVCAILG